MQQIGRYQILEEIARGGMGAVYKAQDPSARSLVAIKLLHGGGGEVARKRFQREAQALARLDHPSVVRVFEIGLAPGGEPYMAMEYVEGTSLQARLDREGALPPEEAVRLTGLLCSAVQACHRAGVIHRDLKPDNVLVTAEGDLKLADFGLVRDVDPSSSRTQLTVEGKFLGSPGFWAPEQARGDLERIDGRTDVYGLGATLFALLTGSAPDSGSTLVEIMTLVHKVKPAPSSLNPAVPRWLDAVVSKALAIEPQDRFQDPAQLGSALSEPPGATGHARLALAAGVMAAGLVFALAIVTLAQAPPHPSQTEILGPAQPPPSADDSGAEALVALDRGEAPADDLPGQRLAGQGSEVRPALTDPELTAKLLEMVDRSNELLTAGRGPDAVAVLTEVIELDPGNYKAYYNRGLARASLGDWQGQVDDCTEAIRLEPGFASAYVNRSMAWANLGQWQRQLDDSEAAIRLDPGAPKAHFNRGVAQANLGDSRAAIRSYGEAIRLAPEYAEAYNERGIAHYTLDDFPAAAADFSRAVVLNPGFTKAKQNLQLVREWVAELQEDGE